MGNFPAKSMSIPHRSKGVLISTRSDPPYGFVVEKELGMILVTSRTFRRGEVGRDERASLEEALELSRKECKALGGTCVLSAYFEIKQFGEEGGWMCYNITGMACVVKRASKMITITSSNNNNNIPVATAEVVLPYPSYYEVYNPAPSAPVEEIHNIEQWGSV